MAVQGNNLAAFIDYVGLELVIPQSTGDLGLELAMTVIPGGKLGKGLLKGEKALRVAVKRLGLDPKQASKVLHRIKHSVGRKGADNIWIDPRNGNVIAPETGEVIDNLFD